MSSPTTRIGLWAVFLLSIGQAQAADRPSSEPPVATERQAEVARRGADVMPFDLARTTHVFTKTASGGTQRVVAKQRGDADQVRSVRSHLRAIAGQFRRGDYSAPAQIHGESMPGLATLRTAPRDAIGIRYADVPGGGMITFSAADPRLIAALHDWFDAQLLDHGADARAGHAHEHGGHSMHEH